ncbi:MAG: hypothetical protein OK404_03925 [Thaumarchaeota archaeon]|nr:hypothetical protein [Nitrososphaerota archaeon]
MKPLLGVSIEILTLLAILGAGYLMPPGAVYLLYVIVAQLSATYLVHCPAHYIVGIASGIRFKRIRLSRTTLARALPPRMGRVARLIPILTLTTDKSSLVGLPRSRVSAMYVSGTLASSASAFVIAGAITISGSLIQVILTWAVAFGYLLFDVVFSPRSGDLMRAKRFR